MIQKLRIASLIIVHLLILAHIYIFGDKVVGSLDFQEFFHNFIRNGIINSGVVLVLIAFLATLIFGRIFCGWACHFGAVQEFAWWVFDKVGIKPITINSSLVTLLPIFILFNFFIIPNLAYAINQPWKGIIVQMGMPEIWAFLPGFMIGLMTFIIDGFLIVYLLGRKGFCRFLCPWGAFLKLPNSLAMFKVRNVGGCSSCGNCTDNCPIGIDVNYEINNYGKVTNTNCTSCFICTEGCPTSAISYKWESPFSEEFTFSQYALNKEMYKLDVIKNKFLSIHKKDFLFFILTIFFGFCIDGLYGMGHFLSFGIALILSYHIITIHKLIKNKISRCSIVSLIVLIIFWHGIIKYSMWKGIDNYDKNNYKVAIIQLERVVKMYPKSIGRFHIILGSMYLENKDFISAKHHAAIALKINPDHKAPLKLLEEINNSIVEYEK